ncbi:MAG TPA: hypothetical protein VNN22_12690 [Verrucomicrobiae bacterium]|nr:hypothetical protein [Verrucomicrobiae bacterium]
MKNPIPSETPEWNPSGGNGHGTVLARAVSSDTPRLLIAAIRFYSNSKSS